MPYPDLLDPAARSGTDVARPFPVAGTVLLVFTLAGAGLLVLPPVRLVGLLLVLPIGAAMLYVWFRSREQTNGALTVIGLAVLAVTLGVGVAMTIAARVGPPQGTPVDLTTSGTSVGYDGALHPGQGGQAGQGQAGQGQGQGGQGQPAAPENRLVPAPSSSDNSSTGSATHRTDPDQSRRLSAPDLRQSDHGIPNDALHPANNPANVANRPDNANNNPANRPDNAANNPDNANNGPSNNPDGNNPDNTQTHSTDGNNTDSAPTDSAPTNSTDGNATPNHQASPYCSLGQFKLNDDGTGDVCADSDGQGHYVWRRHVSPPGDKSHHSHSDD